MASRPSPPAGPNRRRPSPAMPGGWIWLVILGMAVVTLYLSQEIGSRPEINYNEFLALSKAKNLDKVTLVGDDTIQGEVKDLDKVASAEVKKRLGARKVFTTTRPPGDALKLAGDLQANDPELQVRVE